MHQPHHDHDFQLEEWDSAKGAKTVRIGTALYPGAAVSMFNHSCAPNAVTVNVGGAGAIVVATRNIPKSAEICVSYSVSFQACHYRVTILDGKNLSLTYF